MSKPLYKSTTAQAAVSSFAILLINTGYAMWNPDTGSFRAPSQIEVATILGGAIALKETLEGRKRAVESIGAIERFEDTPSPSYYIPTEPNYEAIAALPSAEYTWNVEPEKPFAEELDSVDLEEDDHLDIDWDKLEGKYYLISTTKTKLKTSTEQSGSDTSAWVDVAESQKIFIDAWKFLKEKNSHIQVTIDEHKNINDGVFYVYAPHFKLYNSLDKPVEIDAPTSVIPVVKKNLTVLRLPGYESVFYLENPIYPGSHFTWAEATKNGSRIPQNKGVVDNIIKQAKELDKLRAHLGNIPLVVTSFYRDPRSNAAVGGAAASSHLTGNATDIVSPSMPTSELQRRILDYWKAGGIGKAADRKHPFVHVSSDGWLRTWTY